MAEREPLRLIMGPALGLAAPVAERVVGMAAADSATGTALVDRRRLAEALERFDRHHPAIDVIVFLTADDDPADPAIARLVEALDAEHAAAIRRVPAVNAAKRVRDGVVVEAVDRATLNLLRTPEIVDRRALVGALSALGTHPEGDTVNPTRLVADAGGAVAVVDC